MKPNRLVTLYNKDGTRTVLASIISILIGLAVGSIIVLIVGLTSSSLSGRSTWEGIRLVLFGILSTGRDASGSLTFGFNPTSIGNMLFRATPLIMTGLSVAVAYKTGLFNIGAPGQYLMGTMASLMLALGIPTDVVPAGLVWVIAFLGGMAAGAVWGAIPGFVKAYLNINEVLASIMTNWIAANVVTWAFDVSNFKNVVESTKSAYVYKTTFNGVETPKFGLDQLFPGSQVNGGIIIAIVIAILMYVIMTKTTLGYQLKACGSNRHAARYAGIKDKRNIVLSMAIAGGLAGAGAALYYLSGNTEFYWQTYQSLPDAGFNGIPCRPARGQQPRWRHLHRPLHVHAGHRRSAAHRSDAVQRVYNRRHNRHHRLPERFLPGHQDAPGRPQEAQARQGSRGRGIRRRRGLRRSSGRRGRENTGRVA